MEYGFALLHTAQSHIATFSDLLDQLAPEVAVSHRVNSNLLTHAQIQGLDEALEQQLSSELTVLSEQADTVICTCSTLGGLAEQLAVKLNRNIIRIDRAMADSAVNTGKRIAVVATLSSSLIPTEQLLLQSASRLGVSPQISLHCIEAAWDWFEQGDQQRYLQLIAEYLHFNKLDADVIVLAQASMAAVVPKLDLNVPVLSSPRMGIEHAVHRREAATDGDKN